MVEVPVLPYRFSVLIVNRSQGPDDSDQALAFLVLKVAIVIQDNSAGELAEDGDVLALFWIERR